MLVITLVKKIVNRGISLSQRDINTYTFLKIMVALTGIRSNNDIEGPKNGEAP
jgi:hypothetical protein